MGQDNGSELLTVLQKIRDIRNDQIYSQQIGAGKHDAAVYGDGRVAVFDQHHIKAKLTEATQWDDSKRFHAGSNAPFLFSHNTSRPRGWIFNFAWRALQTPLDGLANLPGEHAKIARANTRHGNRLIDNQFDGSTLQPPRPRRQ